jgi:hypothetical protein
VGWSARSRILIESWSTVGYMDWDAGMHRGAQRGSLHAVVLARVGAVGPDDHHVFYQPFLRGRTRPAGCAVAGVSENLGSGRKEGQ